MRRAALLIAVMGAVGIAASLAATAGARESPVVLGGVVYGAPTGHGWGAAHPKPSSPTAATPAARCST